MNVMKAFNLMKTNIFSADLLDSKEYIFTQN